LTFAGLTEVLHCPHRPGHFDGAARVVTKLFQQAVATDPFFAERDFQQLRSVRRMAADLDIPVTVHGCPTIREIAALSVAACKLLLSDRAQSTTLRPRKEMQMIAKRLAHVLKRATKISCRPESWRAISAKG
jgi:pantoate--beta-alanine ligase